MLARCIELTSVEQVSGDVSRFLAYGSAATEDGVLAGTVISARWRGWSCATTRSVPGATYGHGW